MASKALKGLTIKIGGDTSELLDSLKDVEKKGSDLSKELGEINKLLKLDPNNTQLLAQKQKVLAESITNTRDKLDKLKEAEKQVQKQFERGEVSEAQVRALQREIVKTESKLNSYENAAKETAEQLEKVGDASDEAADSVEDVGDAAEDSGDGFTVAKGAVADFIGNGLSALVGAAKDAISSVLELSDATREYRNEMAKLDTAFQMAGLSADAANKTYLDLYGILGDEGAAVEAAQQLAKISKNEADLEKNTRILTGVMAEYGNSIPTEGLAEGMAATAAMGEVQGVLADALEWQGVNLDDFNEKLGALSTEEERASLIQETLTGLYGESADAYLENNSAVIEANKSQADLAATQADLGEKVAPLTQKYNELKTQALSWLIETGLPALRDGFTWVKDNIPTLVGALGSFTAAWLTFGGAQKIVDTWNKIVLISWKAIDAVMKANPIGLIITAITLLVSAFIYLWQNCEGFRNFWIGLWEGIKTAAQAVADWFVVAFTAVGDFFASFGRGVQKVFAGAWEGVSAAWSGATKFFRGVWTGITGAFSAAGSWFKGVFQKAWQGIKDVFAPVGDFFGGIWDTISEKFSTIGTKVADAIGGAFKSAINAVIAVVEGAINLVPKAINGAIHLINKLPGVEIGKIPLVSLPRLYRGGVLEKGQVGLLEGDGAEAVVPLDQNKKWLSKVAEQLSVLLTDERGGPVLERSLQSRADTLSPAVVALEGLPSKLDRILEAIENGQILTIDGEALVGATSNKMDSALGRRRALAARGAI